MPNQMTPAEVLAVMEGCAADLATCEGHERCASRLYEATESVRAAFAELEARQWRPIETAPKDGTECLYWQPGYPGAINGKAARPCMRVDAFSPRWPSCRYQCPESPYTLWMPLPPTPQEPGRG